MSRTLVVSPRAQQEIDEIWDYTAEHCDREQANRYVADLRYSIEALAAGKRTGRPCDHIRTGYLRLSSGSHVIFYMQTDATIMVVRILHQRMDFRRHL